MSQFLSDATSGRLKFFLGQGPVLLLPFRHREQAVTPRLRPRRRGRHPGGHDLLMDIGIKGDGRRRTRLGRTQLV